MDSANQPTTPWSMILPQAFLFFSTKHAPGFLEHVSCGVSQFSSILGSPKHPDVFEPAAGAFVFLQKTSPWILGAYILWSFSIFIDVYLVDVIKIML